MLGHLNWSGASAMRKRIATLVLVLFIAPALSGCLVIGGTALVAGTAVSVTGTALETVGNAGEFVVRTAIPGDGEDDDEDDNSDAENSRDRDRR
tara:strand:- start:1561 stop:1842 length:282 start_codon:yes stop_codon:yes gene_type:complete